LPSKEHHQAIKICKKAFLKMKRLTDILFS